MVWKSIAHDPALSTKSFPNLLAGLANNLANRPKFPPAFDPTIELLEINWNFMVYFYLELTYKCTMMIHINIAEMLTSENCSESDKLTR